MDNYRDFVKTTPAGRRFNIRFHSDGRVQEWPIDGDISNAWEGTFHAGLIKIPHTWHLGVHIGHALTEYEEDRDFEALIGLETIDREAVGSSMLWPSEPGGGISLLWFQGRGVRP